ncbi:hypothetical protein ACWDTG_25905 [Rhodococcus zopfii]
MTGKYDRESLFGPGILDELLAFDNFPDDEDDTFDDTPPQWMSEAAVAAADILGVEVARSSVLGFDEALAAVVLADTKLQEQLRRHWADNGVSSRVRALAAEDGPIGRLHTELIAVAGPATSYETVSQGDAVTDASDNVIVGPWTVSPRLVHNRAAASKKLEVDTFTARNDEWGLTFLQTPTSNGEVIVEVRFDSDPVGPLDIVRVRVGDEDRLLVLKPLRPVGLSAKVKLRGDRAWGPASVDIFYPVPADRLPSALLPLVTESVARAPIPEQNLWRRIQRQIAADHPLAIAIAGGLG